MVAGRIYCLLGLTALLLLPALGAEAEIERSLPAPPQYMTADPPIHVRPAFASSPIGYSPGQIRHAYGFDQLSSTGYGQTIAIVDAYGSPTIQNDLNIFCAKFGLRSQSLQIAYSTVRSKQVDLGWELETALDVEWAGASVADESILLVGAMPT